jgi:phosphoglycerate dehydrogenase-like enzyme
MLIAVLDDYQHVGQSFADWSRLDGHEVVFFHQPYLGVDDAARSLHAFEIVCAMRERTAFPAELLDRLPNLRLLVTTGMRNASIDLEAAAARGVTVCGTEVAGMPTAELAWGLILALARHIPEEDAKVRAGGWQSTVGTGLAGTTLGIVGLGRLGSTVAGIGAAFGMRLVAWSENLTAERGAECGAELVSKDELLRTADVVTIHLVLSDRTRGLIGERELGLMKPTAFLVNTSRGPIVDEAALVAALEAGAIAGAGLDVYDREPLPDYDALLSAPNTVLTPHLGYVTEESYRTFYEQTVEDIEAFLAGRPVRLLSVSPTA